MTNEELVALIQDGARDKLLDLWEQVEKFVSRQARKRYLLSGGLGGVEVEDLYQSGYIALAAAVDSYDPEAGRSFISWLALAIKNAFAEAGGYRSRKQARDPLHRAGSMDAPVQAGDEDSVALGELIPDPGAVQAFQSIEDRLYLEQLHDALEKALIKLPAEQRDILRRYYYHGETRKAIAADTGVYEETVRQRELKALRTLRRRRDLQQFVEDRTPYFGNWGAHTGERTTEMITIMRERLAGQWTGGGIGCGLEARGHRQADRL